MKILKPLLILFPIFVSFSVVAAKDKNACQLKLISTEAPRISQNSSSEGERFLSFQADMKKMGVSFKGTTPTEVRAEFEALSDQNVSRYIRSFAAYVQETSGKELIQRWHHGNKFHMWRNIAVPKSGFGQPKLLSDAHMLDTKIFQRDLSIWSRVQKGLNGVIMNLEITKDSLQSVMSRSLAKNEGRIGINENFKTDWIYVLPLPGNDNMEYTGMDSEFLLFLMIYAPEKFTQFMEDFRAFFPDTPTRSEVADITSDFSRRLRSFLEIKDIASVLKAWSPNFRDLVLTKDDAMLLLAFSEAQEYPNNLMNILSVVIPGDVGPGEYVIRELPEGEEPHRVGPRNSLTRPNGIDIGPFPTGPNTR